MNVIVKKDPMLVALSAVALIVMGLLVASGKLESRDFLVFLAGLGIPSLLGRDDTAKEKDEARADVKAKIDEVSK